MMGRIVPSKFCNEAKIISASNNHTNVIIITGNFCAVQRYAHSRAREYNNNNDGYCDKMH